MQFVQVMHRFADASLFPQAKGQRHNLYVDGQEKVLRIAMTAADIPFNQDSATQNQVAGLGQAGNHTGQCAARRINGDPLRFRTVQVPKGRPTTWNPPSDWR